MISFNLGWHVLFDKIPLCTEIPARNSGAGRCERSRPFATSLWLFDIYPKSRLDAGTRDSENERLIYLKITPIEKEHHLNQTFIFGFHISFWVFGWLGGWEGFFCCLAVESWQFFSNLRLHRLGSLLMQPPVKLPTTSLHIGPGLWGLTHPFPIWRDGSVHPITLDLYAALEPMATYFLNQHLKRKPLEGWNTSLGCVVFLFFF